MGNRDRMEFLFPDFCWKALTFSYDDGTIQDRRLAKIFQKYALQATFNLNSGTFDEMRDIEHCGFHVNFDKVHEAEVHDLYAPFEVAVHTLTHPILPSLSDEDFDREVLEDKANLERLTGKPVIGLAYPGGSFDQRTVNRLRQLGIRYGRTIQDTYTFDLPDEFLEWHPTCHDHENRIMELANQFLQYDGHKLQLFYIWGHSFELNKTDTDRWHDIHVLCHELAGKPDIWYASNGEIYSYISAMRQMEKTGGERNITGQALYVVKDGKKRIWRDGQTI